MSVSDASIVLIGPTGSGKSTVGRELSAILGWPLIELDDLRKDWYPEFGLPSEAEAEAVERGGLLELIATWKPYELQSVERVMAEYPTKSVIAFGGGQSVYVDSSQIERAKTTLAAAGRVILLQPSDDRDRCLHILQERIRHEEFVRTAADPEAFLRDFTPILKMQIQSESNEQLATELIVTGQSTPTEIARHILATAGETGL